MIADELERLNQLRLDGTLSEEEFQQAKASLLAGGASGSDRICGLVPSTWMMLMHLSQLLTVSGIGIIAPIAMWAIGKDESRECHKHGLMIINWMISFLIYTVISGILCFVLVGIPMLVVLGILHVVFPIIGGIKAGSGEFWRYPLTIEFFAYREQ